MNSICDPEKCAGCFACMNICPKDAISEAIDIMGISKPAIDKERCVDCGLCAKACPAVSPAPAFYNELSPQPCYAIWSNHIEESNGCASGGVATAFSRYVIKQGGAVFGAAFDESLMLRHKIVEKEDGLEGLKNSKYVQSDIGYTYRQAKRELDNNRPVLFIGTPCQISGLRGYLQKPYEKLITVDLLCAGTPPMTYLKEYLDWRQTDKQVTSLTFRGDKSIAMTLWHNDEVLSRTPYNEDLYFSSFFSRFTLRTSCLYCPYASRERVSDITIGDFLGLDINTLEPAHKGRISLMLLNTNKGALFFKETKTLFTYQERALDEALAGNVPFRHPSPFSSAERTVFETEYPEAGFVDAVKKTFSYSKININRDS